MRVYKYKLDLERNQILELPIGAAILCVRTQQDEIVLYAEVDPKESEIEQRVICVYGTGHDMSNGLDVYIGTVSTQQGTYVWHIYERK